MLGFPQLFCRLSGSRFLSSPFLIRVTFFLLFCKGKRVLLRNLGIRMLQGLLGVTVWSFGNCRGLRLQGLRMKLSVLFVRIMFPSNITLNLKAPPFGPQDIQNATLHPFLRLLKPQGPET